MNPSEDSVVSVEHPWQQWEEWLLQRRIGKCLDAWRAAGKPTDRVEAHQLLRTACTVAAPGMVRELIRAGVAPTLSAYELAPPRTHVGLREFHENPLMASIWSYQHSAWYALLEGRRRWSYPHSSGRHAADVAVIGHLRRAAQTPEEVSAWQRFIQDGWRDDHLPLMQTLAQRFSDVQVWPTVPPKEVRWSAFGLLLPSVPTPWGARYTPRQRVEETLAHVLREAFPSGKVPADRAEAWALEYRHPDLLLALSHTGWRPQDPDALWQALLKDLAPIRLPSRSEPIESTRLGPGLACLSFLMARRWVPQHLESAVGEAWHLLDAPVLEHLLLDWHRYRCSERAQLPRYPHHGGQHPTWRTPMSALLGGPNTPDAEGTTLAGWVLTSLYAEPASAAEASPEEAVAQLTGLGVVWSSQTIAHRPLLEWLIESSWPLAQRWFAPIEHATAPSEATVRQIWPLALEHGFIPALEAWKDHSYLHDLEARPTVWERALEQPAALRALAQAGHWQDVLETPTSTGDSLPVALTRKALGAPLAITSQQRARWRASWDALMEAGASPHQRTPVGEDVWSLCLDHPLLAPQWLLPADWARSKTPELEAGNAQYPPMWGRVVESLDRWQPDLVEGDTLNPYIQSTVNQWVGLLHQAGYHWISNPERDDQWLQRWLVWVPSGPERAQITQAWMGQRLPQAPDVKRPRM